jgi:3-oxoacyl-[acyl-carrier-protein] synthase-3
MLRSYIAGTGHAVPSRVITNQDLVDKYGIDTTNEWIVQRSGIEERRYCEDGTAAVDLAIEASRMAVKDAGLQMEEIDFIVFATLSPEQMFPGSGVFLQRALGLAGVGAMDIRNQCSGFLYALAAARGVVETGMAKNVLVVGAEKHSAGIDLSTEGRQVACLFGDGAGAIVLRGSSDPAFLDTGRGIRWMNLGADGNFAEALETKLWNNKNANYIALGPDGNGIVTKKMMYPHMDGKVVFRHAVEKMILSVMGMCMENNIEPSDLDLVVCHQANMRINEYVRDQLGLPPEKVPNNIQKYGNTTAATIPLLLSELNQQGRLKPGMKIAMVAFGSGFTWGSAYVVW